MKHVDHIERYPGTLLELAEELGNLRYDALAAFLVALAAKLGTDAVQDTERGRTHLATELRAASGALSAAASAIDKAWTICEPHM
ncbi:MAG: hypothetical protein L0241_13695 [Planctomycetia bacterium]|nr:hypothetical protein [Planctomycetia bacterium]